MCNVLKKATARLNYKEKAEFNIRLTLVRSAKRQRLWVAQDGKCHYCDRETVLPKHDNNKTIGLIATLDHIITQSNGGTDNLNNLVVACSSCNNKRRDMDYDEFYNLMKTPGAWEEYRKELAREKTKRDEIRRQKGIQRHNEMIALEKAAAQARLNERLRKHAPNVIKDAQRKGYVLPSDPEEQIQWAIDHHIKQCKIHQQVGPDGIQLLRNWIHRANFVPRKEGKGWIAFQECSSMETLPWKDLTGDTEAYMMA